MRLSEQQVRFFQDFGFLRFDGLLADRIDAIAEGFDRIWTDRGGGHAGQAHDRQRRSALLPFLDVDEYMSSLIDDPRIDGIAASLLGDDYNYTASDGNYYVGDTPWHSDYYMARKYASIKMALYLEPRTSDTGCLRVIPGSHHFGDTFGDALQPVAQQPRDQQAPNMWGVDGRDVPAVALETVPGDLLVFNHKTKHASFGGDTMRRMFTINMEQRHAEQDLDEIRADIGNLARFWTERAYGDAMINTASPAKMRHLQQRLANDGHLPELVKKAREEMDEPSRS